MTDEVYTHGHHESVLRSHTWRTAENSAGYLLPALRPGLDLLDGERPHDSLGRVPPLTFLPRPSSAGQSLLAVST